MSKLTFGCLLHPLVTKNLVNCQTLSWVVFQNTLEQRYCLGRGTVSATFEINFTPYNLLMKFSHIFSLEWYSAVKHRVEYNAGRPHIRLEPYIALALKNLKSHIGWSSTLLKNKLFGFSNKLADSEVADFDMTLRCKQNIVQLDVLVQYVFGMAVF